VLYGFEIPWPSHRMRDAPLPAIEEKITDLIKDKRIFWSADGLRSQQPVEQPDSDHILPKTPTLDRSGSIERRLAAAIQVM
jgi:hypothetical protein